jgi:hypothetical protein
LLELTLQHFVCCFIIFVAPENEFEHLRADVSKAAQCRTQTAARCPILLLRRGDIFVGGTRIPVTVKQM